MQEAKTPSPLFVKRCLALNQPVSGQIHPPFLAPSTFTGSWTLEMGDHRLISTISSHTPASLSDLVLGFLNHLYLTLIPC